MEGNENIDALMMPVLDAIRRHVKDKDAITDIYNRAYEALMKAIDGKGAEMLDRDIEDTRQPDEGEDAELLWECVYNELPKELVEFVEDEIARLERKAYFYMRQNKLMQYWHTLYG